MPGLHLQRNRRKSAIQKIYDGRGNFNDGCVASGARLLRRLRLAVQPDCLKGRVVCGTVYGKKHYDGFINQSIMCYDYQCPLISDPMDTKLVTSVFTYRVPTLNTSEDSPKVYPKSLKGLCELCP